MKYAIISLCAGLWIVAGFYNLSISVPHYQCWDERLGGRQSDDWFMNGIAFVGGPISTPAIWSIWGGCDGTR